MKDKDELIEHISKLSHQDLKSMYARACSNKNWAIVKLICESQNPNKPPEISKAKALEEAVQKGEWKDTFDIQKEFSTGNVVLVQGPNLKSPWTYQLEDLFRKLLSKALFTVGSDDNNTIITFPDGTSYNWSEIRKHADFKDLSLEESDYKLYQNYMAHPYNGCELDPKKEEVYRSQLYESYIKNGQPIPDPPITFEEMQAINIYTTQAFGDMNGVLRGTFEPTTNSQNARNAIIQSVMCAHGLRKIPQTFLNEAYRGTDTAHLSAQIEAAASHDVVKLDGFVSSCTVSESKYTYVDNGVTLKVKNLIGAYIAPISKYPNEKEFLLPPTAIQITNYNQGVRNRHEFEAHCVSELSCLSAKGLERHIDGNAMNIEDKFPFVLERLAIDLASNINPDDSTGYYQAKRLYKVLSQNYHDFKSNLIDKNTFNANCNQAIDLAASNTRAHSKWDVFVNSLRAVFNPVLPSIFDPPVKNPQSIMHKFKDSVQELVQEKAPKQEKLENEEPLQDNQLRSPGS